MSVVEVDRADIVQRLGRHVDGLERADPGSQRQVVLRLGEHQRPAGEARIAAARGKPVEDRSQTEQRHRADRHHASCAQAERRAPVAAQCAAAHDDHGRSQQHDDRDRDAGARARGRDTDERDEEIEHRQQRRDRAAVLEIAIELRREHRRERHQAVEQRRLVVAVREQADQRPGIGNVVEVEAAVLAAQQLKQADPQADDAQHQPADRHHAALAAVQEESADQHGSRRRQRQQRPPGLLRRHAERQRWTTEAGNVQDVRDRLATRQLRPDRGGQWNELQDGHGDDERQQDQRDQAAFRRRAREHQVEAHEQQRQARHLHRREAERIALAGAPEHCGDHQQQHRAGEERRLRLVFGAPRLAPGVRHPLEDRAVVRGKAHVRTF